MAESKLTVKPLDWEDDEEYGEHIASALIGQYMVALVHSSYRVILNYADGASMYQTVLAEGLGLEAAKEFAQADYEQRVLSELEAEA